MDKVESLNWSEIWSKFVYDYTFQMDYGKTVKVTVDYLFNDISELETLSCFPHGQRREFAKHVLRKYSEEGKYHCLSEADIFNPFARKLETLFAKGIQVYWRMRPTDTILIVTGLG